MKMHIGRWEESAMPDKYNPFRPNSTVQPGMFTGRYEELDVIEHCLLQTRNSNPQHFLIEGERGIGKSSLMLFEHVIASGKGAFRTGEHLNFITLNIVLQDQDDLLSVVKKISGRLQSEVRKRDALKSLMINAWEFVSRIEAAGVRLHKNEQSFSETELMDRLIDDFVCVCSSLPDNTDGVLMLVDEADRGAERSRLGLFCKLLTEELSRQAAERLCIGMAGLPGVVNLLRASHESAPRIFRSLDLAPLSDEECVEVLEKGLAEANSKNPVAVTMAKSVKDLIASLSEGYPHFLQEFAYCAFEKDDDNYINIEDVTGSLFGENGAFDQLGKRYFNHAYFATSSNDYRSVLHAMAEHGDDWIERNQIIAKSGVKASIVDNALRALKAKNIILQDEQVRGRYRLPTRSFATWINVRAKAEQRL
jgi:hypothetical protein